MYLLEEMNKSYNNSNFLGFELFMIIFFKMFSSFYNYI